MSLRPLPDPDPALIEMADSRLTLSAQVESALALGVLFRVVRAHREKTGWLRRRTVCVIDEIEWCHHDVPADMATVPPAEVLIPESLSRFLDKAEKEKGRTLMPLLHRHQWHPVNATNQLHYGKVTFICHCGARKVATIARVVTD